MKEGRQSSGNTYGESLSLDGILLNEHEGAPLPENEEERITFLRQLNVLDTVGEDAFDVITSLLTDIYNVPIALVSLVDSKRQWFKSCVGLDVSETTRDLSFCAHLLLPETPEILLVPDATLDPRFQNSALVKGDPFIRFYCGAPIICGGVRLGSLCIIGREPRDNIGQKDAMLLANFASIVAGLIDKERKQATQYEMLDHPSFLIQVTKDKWPIMYSNELGKNLMGAMEGDEPRFLDLFKLDEVPTGSKLNEIRAQECQFGDRSCMCTFHPASRNSFGKDIYNRIHFPYREPSQSAVSEPAAQRSEGAPYERSVEYNFVVVKWAKEGGVSIERGPSGRHLSFINRASELNVIQSAKSFDSALEQDLAIIMLTSEYCASCVHFADFYTFASRVTRGTQFNVISVDESPSLARRCTTGAVFLPSVFFYKKGKVVDQLQGSHCAQFRKKLAALLKPESSFGGGLTAEKLDMVPGDRSVEKLGEKSDDSAPSAPSVGADDCIGPSCLFNNSQSDVEQSSFADLTMRLEAERAYSRSLEASLSQCMAAQLVELRKTHDTSLARISLLKRDLMTRRQRKVSTPSSTPFRINEVGDVTDLGEDLGDSASALQELPKYHFHGTVAKFLRPMLSKSKVLIYGGSRADFLEGGMRQMGIDVSRQARTARNDAIPTQGRRGRRIAIVDVIDVRSPQATWEWFEKVSDALPVGGILATISADFDLLEVLGMLGETYGWSITCTEGSKRDYGIIALEKGSDSDSLIQSWAVESFVEKAEE